MDKAQIAGAFHGAATVGERGQVVIPAEARDRAGIAPGDKLLVFTHPTGTAVVFLKLEDVQAITDALKPVLNAIQIVTANNGDQAE